MNILFYIGISIFSVVLTLVVKNIAIKKEILDHPNKRSSHVTPTPRGGGLAIVISFYSALFLFMLKYIDFNVFVALLFALPLAFVGLLDDIFDISSLIRLSVQILCAIGALWAIEVSYFYWPIAILFIVWFTNLFNFLDGIDGYLSSEVIFLAIMGFIFFNNPLWALLGAAVAGFLPFNWPKASIFMGDVGSTTIGFIIAVLILYDATTYENFVTWIILTSPFWFDATYTLLRRFFRGEKIMNAHRKHIFQRAVRSGLSHLQVTLILSSINLFIFILLLIFNNSISTVLLLSILLISVLSYIVEKKVPFND